MTTPTAAPAPGLDFTVIVPAHNAESTLPDCLGAILAAHGRAADILVVDDGSSDATGQIARELGVRVVRNATALRPAKARNRGVAECDTAVIVFVDADVILAPDAVQRLLAHFSDPGVTAVIGSYDDRPAPRPYLSRYRNLLHHFVHQQAPATAETFWTGIGAVRRDAFLEAGGFDSRWENIEDVELGLRIRANGGTIRMDRAAQGTHLKIWTLGSMLRTDYAGRAKPWTRLIRQGRIRAGAMNTSLRHQLSAICVAAAVVALALALIWPLALVGVLVLFGIFLASNLRFIALLWRLGGPALVGVGLVGHGLHYLAALAGYVAGRLEPSEPPRPD